MPARRGVNTSMTVHPALAVFPAVTRGGLHHATTVARRRPRAAWPGGALTDREARRCGSARTSIASGVSRFLDDLDDLDELTTPDVLADLDA